MALDFNNDTVHVFGETLPLTITTSGHYALPITQSTQLLNEFEHGYLPIITLTVLDNKSNKEIALKLHRQFAHPRPESLLKLLGNAGDKWR